MAFEEKTLNYKYMFWNDDQLWDDHDTDISVGALPLPGDKIVTPGLTIAGNVIFDVEIYKSYIEINFIKGAVFTYAYKQGDYTTNTSFNGIVFEDKEDDFSSFTDIRMRTNIVGMDLSDVIVGADKISVNLTAIAATEDSYIEIKPMFQLSESISAGQSISEGALVKSPNANSGIATYAYSGERASYKMTKFDGQAVIEQPGRVSRSFSDAERVQFSDGTLAFDTDGNAGQAYRLYQAAFDRKPDQSGLGFWIHKLDDGLALVDAAEGFVNSQEFKSVYGSNVANSEYVEQLYENVLGRTGEAAGTSYWEGQLADGVSKAVVLAGFAGSDENIVGVSSAIENGIWYV